MGRVEGQSMTNFIVGSCLQKTRVLIAFIRGLKRLFLFPGEVGLDMYVYALSGTHN